MQTYVCVTCGTQFPPSGSAPEGCPICDDDRQYVRPGGQAWTTLADLAARSHNVIRAVAPRLTGAATEPPFAIGQQAYLIQTDAGNVLWDCISLIDDATVTAVRALGGIAAIAISHPHFFASMVEWSRAFDGAPIHLHAELRPWVMRPDPAIVFWDGKARELLPGITAIRCDGHFPGASVLHWADGADGRGALFTGDTIFVASDHRWVSFMYSYPNVIPLDARAVRGVAAAVAPYRFDRLYGGWDGRIVTEDAHAAVQRSADRYVRRIGG